MKKTIALLVLALMHSFCIAQSWVNFGVSHDGSSFSYDASSISKQDKAFKVTILGNYKEPLKIRAGIMFSQKSTRIIDCTKPREKMIKLVAYRQQDAKGGELNSFQSPNPAWEDLEDTSVINDLRNKLCGLG